MGKRLLETLESRVLLSSSIGPTTDVVWHGQHEQAIADQFVVQTLHPNAFFSLAQQAKFTDIKSLGGDGFYRFDSALSPSIIAALGAYHTDAMAAVQPNFVRKAADTFPSDPYAIQQWHLSNTGQVEAADYNGNGVIDANENQAGIPGIDLNMRKAWDVTTGSSTVIVAVLDTGIDLTHPDLIPNIYTNPHDNSVDGIDNDANGFIDDVHGWNFVSDNNDVTDDNGHGTHVSGIIGAVGNNSIGVSGVDWNVQILPIKVLDASGLGTDDAILSGINYVLTLKAAGNNIMVMNESLGGPAFPFNLVGSNAIKEAGNAGIIDVVAAGNDAENLVQAPVTPANLSLSLPNVVTVGAIDNQGKMAIFSNFGAGVDLAAPGVNILSTAPTSGFSVVTPLDPADPIAVPYGFLSGTSQAAPQVAGILALEAAVRPNATPAQYKKALLDGVTPDANLASVNGLPPKVNTGGIANAFNAVRNITNQFVKADTVRMGNWHNFYGQQGAYVVGESTTFPSFVNATLNGVSPVILHDSTHSVIALQKVSDPSDRIAAYGAAATSETIDLNFTDGALHRVSLYVADLDGRARTETLQIIDGNNQSVVFDTQVASKFFHGQYFTWDLSGHVLIQITNSGGPNAVFSGIFFDAPPANANAFAGQDSSTLGFDWRHLYGSQGSVIVGDDNTNALPSYIPVPNFDVRFASGDSASHNRVLRQNIVSPIVPQKNFAPNVGIAADWFDQDHFDISMIPTDSLAHKVTLYAVDYGNRRRSERIEAIDQNTGDVLYTQDISNFAHGTFVSFVVSGPTLFRVTNTGGPDAVVSAMYFDAPAGEKLQYTGTDQLSLGNWRQAGYGQMLHYIAGQNLPGVDVGNDNFIAASNASRFVLSPLTSDQRALEPVDAFSLGRVEAYAFTNTQMSFTLTLNDHTQHQLALYFADYENHHRREAITITDATTGQVLSRHRIANFAHGEYLVYQIRGSVVITINNEGTPNAVLSGIFVT